MHEMDLGIPFRSARCRVNMVTTKVAADIKSFFDRKVCKVLIPEGYDFLLCHEQCKLVFTSICQLAQLDTVDLGADVRGQIVDFGILQEVRE